MALSSDGSRLAIGICQSYFGGKSFCNLAQIQFWDLLTGQPIISMGDKGGFLTDLAFNPDGSRLAAVRGGLFPEIYQIIDPPDFELYIWDRKLSNIAFSPDSESLAFGSPDGDLILWDIDSRLPLGAPLVGGHRGVAALLYESDGSLLAAYDDGTLLQWLIHPENLLEIACSKSDRALTLAEQNQYFPQGGYQNACGK